MTYEYHCNKVRLLKCDSFGLATQNGVGDYYI